MQHGATMGLRVQERLSTASCMQRDQHLPPRIGGQKPLSAADSQIGQQQRRHCRKCSIWHRGVMLTMEIFVPATHLGCNTSTHNLLPHIHQKCRGATDERKARGDGGVILLVQKGSCQPQLKLFSFCFSRPKFREGNSDLTADRHTCPPVLCLRLTA